MAPLLEKEARQIVFEELWRWRLEEAQRDHENRHTAETRAELRRVLRIFTDLTVRGIVPDEAEWLKSQVDGAGRSESDTPPASEECPERQENH